MPWAGSRTRPSDLNLPMMKETQWAPYFTGEVDRKAKGVNWVQIGTMSLSEGGTEENNFGKCLTRAELFQAHEDIKAVPTENRMWLKCCNLDAGAKKITRQGNSRSDPKQKKSNSVRDVTGGLSPLIAHERKGRSMAWDSPRPSSSNNKNGVRLEFVHIPKNAGTAIEAIGLKYNISWGACHFEFPWKHNPNNILRKCPPMNWTFPSSKICYWHFSLEQLQNMSDRFPYNPYDRVSLTDMAKSPGNRKRYFAIARNPFTRLVSMFFQRYGRLNPNGLTPEKLNHWIVNTVLQKDSNVFIEDKGNTFPKCQYQYDRIGNRTGIIDHWLTFENLTAEFNELMEEYGMAPRMDPHEKKFNVASSKKLGVQDLFNSTIEKIINQYPEDFQLGRTGYQTSLS